MSDKQSNFDISDEMIAERRGISNKMPEDMPSWMAKSITKIDKFILDIYSTGAACFASSGKIQKIFACFNAEIFFFIFFCIFL